MFKLSRITFLTKVNFVNVHLHLMPKKIQKNHVVCYFHAKASTPLPQSRGATARVLWVFLTILVTEEFNT